MSKANLREFNKAHGIEDSSCSDDMPGIFDKSATMSSPFFAVKALKNGILPNYQSREATNANELARILALPRTSPPPTKLEHDRFTRLVTKSNSSETTIIPGMTPLLKVETDGPSYSWELNRSCTGFPVNVGFNDRLLEGPEMRRATWRLVKDMHGAIMYASDPDSLILPHVAGAPAPPQAALPKKRHRTCCSYDGQACIFQSSSNP